ncbi:MAG: ABC transporter substrate-binding protein [Candidatus Binatia bacterium]
MMRSLFLTCCTGVVLLTTACGTDADDPIVLGAVYNLSGPQAALDQPSSRGAELAVMQANAAGGVLGQKVKLVIADPEGNLAEVAERARELIKGHKSISAVFGLSDSDMVLAAAPVAADRQLVFMTSGVTSPKLPAQTPDYLFLACFGDNVQAAAAAEYAYLELKARTVAILYKATDTYTTLLQGYFRTRFEELGGKVTAVKSYQTTADQGEAIVGLAEADLVFLSAQEPEEAAAGVTKLRQAGIDVPVFGGDGYDAEDEWSKHPTIKNVYFTTHAYLAPDNPDLMVMAFNDAYRRAYDGRAPDSFAALGYDTVGVLLAAIKAGGSAKPAKVLAALGQLQGYRGVTGTISYEGGSRIPKKSVTILEVRDERPTFVRQMIPEKTPPP